MTTPPAAEQWQAAATDLLRATTEHINQALRTLRRRTKPRSKRGTGRGRGAGS